MDTTTIRPRTSPPAPPPKPKNKAQNGSEFHNEHITNNNIDNYQHINSYQNNNHHTNNNNNFYLSVPPCDEQVVMTPKGKTSNSTVILIERKLVEEVSERVHVAGGDHSGIIINKDVVKGNL